MWATLSSTGCVVVKQWVQWGLMDAASATLAKRRRAVLVRALSSARRARLTCWGWELLGSTQWSMCHHG